MSYRRDLQQLRRARKLAKRQQRQLATIELVGITAVTLHANWEHLTIAVERLTAAPFVDILREALRDRRQALQQEARQLRRDWLEGERLDARPAPAAGPPLP